MHQKRVTAEACSIVRIRPFIFDSFILSIEFFRLLNKDKYQTNQVLFGIFYFPGLSIGKRTWRNPAYLNGS